MNTKVNRDGKILKSDVQDPRNRQLFLNAVVPVLMDKMSFDIGKHGLRLWWKNDGDDMGELVDKFFKNFDLLKKQDKEDKLYCWGCFSKPSQKKLFMCAGCMKARYCGNECHSNDWERHMNWCQKKEAKRKASNK